MNDTELNSHHRRLVVILCTRRNSARLLLRSSKDMSSSSCSSPSYVQRVAILRTSPPGSPSSSSSIEIFTLSFAELGAILEVVLLFSASTLVASPSSSLSADVHSEKTLQLSNLLCTRSETLSGIQELRVDGWDTQGFGLPSGGVCD